MDTWDEDFFNMDGQAYIQIDEDGGGRFEFGAVQSEIDGKGSGKRFEFSFQGVDEGDLVSGWGWVQSPPLLFLPVLHQEYRPLRQR